MDDILIADIGATNCRLAVVGSDGRPARMLKYRGDEVESLEASIARYCEEAKVTLRAAVLAIAAPVAGDTISMTNRAWTFRLSEMSERFGWKAARAVNDFEALAWGLDRLAARDVQPLGGVASGASGTRVVFGPGTGLGVAAVVAGAAGPQVIPTEGGHVVFGAATNDEEPVFARLRAECGSVSAETILSGPGLERLHRALHATPAHIPAAGILASAHGGDSDSAATVRTFVKLLGRFAGDLALTFRASGGVYVGGGVARRIGALLDASAFRQAFEQHPPYTPMLRAIPTMLITFDEPGLLGCAALAEKL